MSGQLKELDMDSSVRDSALHRLADLAASEEEKDFSLSNAQALMGLWGALEACVDDVCLAWLVGSSAEGARESLRGVKVSLADFYYLQEPDRSRLVLDWIKANRASQLKKGVGQFETILAAVGLNGTLGAPVRDLLYYAKTMRNVVAHRGGRIDVRAMEDLPEQAGLHLGDELRVRTHQLYALAYAMVDFAESLIVRAGYAKLPDDFEPPWGPMQPYAEKFWTVPADAR